MDEKNRRRSAEDYLKLIESWQRANGGLRRLPERSWDVGLNNWIMRCRFNQRLSTLNENVHVALRNLGVLFVDEPENQRITKDTYELTRKIVAAIKMAGVDKEDVDETWIDGLEDAGGHALKWLSEMRSMPKTGAGAILLDDVRGMAPHIFDKSIAPFLASTPESSLVQTQPGPLKRNLLFVTGRGRLPDMMSDDMRERELASWWISVHFGIANADAQVATNGTRGSTLMRRLLQAIKDAGGELVDGQWRWWSSCAMELLRSEKDARHWNVLLYTSEPGKLAKRIDVSLDLARQHMQGWDGGPWGVDRECMLMAIERSGVSARWEGDYSPEDDDAMSDLEDDGTDSEAHRLETKQRVGLNGAADGLNNGGGDAS